MMMSMYEAAMVKIEKIEVGRKMYADLYDRGCITKEQYDELMKKLCKQLSAV